MHDELQANVRVGWCVSVEERAVEGETLACCVAVHE
jgi:hypothetical protein